MNKKHLDFSSGDPLLPMTQVARYAFKKSAKDLNQYTFNNTATKNQTIRNILRETGNYFTQRKIHSKGWSGLCLSSQLMTGGGTTEGFELIMRLLAQDVREEQKLRKQPLKPVIVMPTPTYGFFMDNPQNWDIEVATVERDLDNNGRLDRSKLLGLFKELRQQGKRIVAYYDNNPHNPLGIVRSREETMEVADLVMGLNEAYRRDDEKLYRSEGENARHFRWDGPAAEIKLIDDLVYDGLQYEGEPEPLTFAQLGHHDARFHRLFDNTFTLMGTSKAGLANLRAGLVIGHDKYINEMRRTQLSISYSPPKMAMHALQAYFSVKEPFATWRQSHLRTLNKEHKLRGQFMKALINGEAAVPDIQPADRRKMVAAIAQAKKLRPSKAAQLLSRPLEDIKVITTPQAGFFHLLDFSELKGRIYSNEHNRFERYGGNTQITNETHIQNLCESANMHFASGTWVGLPAEKSMVRATFAKPMKEIIDCCDRLRWIAAQTKNPSLIDLALL